MNKDKIKQLEKLFNDMEHFITPRDEKKIEKFVIDTHNEAVRECIKVSKNYDCKQSFCDKDGDIVGGISIKDKLTKLLKE